MRRFQSANNACNLEERDQLHLYLIVFNEGFKRDGVDDCCDELYMDRVSDGFKKVVTLQGAVHKFTLNLDFIACRF